MKVGWLTWSASMNLVHTKKKNLRMECTKVTILFASFLGMYFENV